MSTRNDEKSDHSDNGDEDAGAGGNNWDDDDADILEEPLLPPSPGVDEGMLLPPASSRGRSEKKSAKGSKQSSKKRPSEQQVASASSAAAGVSASSDTNDWGNSEPEGGAARGVNDTIEADEYRRSCGDAYSVKETGLVVNDEKVEENQLMAKTRCMVTMTTIPQQDQAGLPPTMLPRAGKSLEGTDYACGYLELPPGVKKCAECPSSREIFYVIMCEYKKLRVRINNTYFYLSAGSFFAVPAENVYTVENLSQAHRARLTFTISRPGPRPMFAEEDDMESLLSDRDHLREGGDFAEDGAASSQDDVRASPGSSDKDQGT